MLNTYVYITIMCAVTFFIRVLPLTLIRKQIRNTFLKSFLYYVPYVTLSVMTFPAIMHATRSPIAGAVALVAGLAAAFIGANMITVAATCCGLVFVIELLIL